MENGYLGVELFSLILINLLQLIGDTYFMDAIETKQYGEIYSPNNFTELMDFLLSNRLGSRNVWMWRGQSNIAWSIDSGAYRRLLLDKKVIDEKDIIHYEKNLLNQATHKGFRISNGIQLNDFELLAKLQHHGAATRLVDFSKNFLVGLWFCVNENPDKTGLMLGLHSSFIGGDSEGTIEDISTYSDIVSDLDKYNFPLFIEPPVVSPRISSQHGVFLYSAVDENLKYGSLKLTEEEFATIFIAITPEFKKQSLVILEETFDIRYPTLFPDLDGFSKYNGANISSRKMWRW
ncbi:FRG domain-containing protein [Bacillus sp. SM2101]|uniref:FRG domain-containing protein n=1 Tax=Bacillus sp. SM2101 TaxID=2805366 RepID=UPI001BDDE508|nr:FRG domain-containing protein [Bacillus sp. SM2101]